MNAPTPARPTRTRRRFAFLGIVAVALAFGATVAWLAPQPVVASVGATIGSSNSADRLPGPPSKRGERPRSKPSPSPVASTSPAPSASPSSAPAASPAPSAAPSAAPSPAGWSPTGVAPSGWMTYRGHANVPFAMYYPAGWTVDESRAQQGRVYFYAPGVTAPVANAVWVLIDTTGVKDPNANLDMLRDQYYTEIKQQYQKAAIDVSRNNRFSGMTFASLGVTCDNGGNLDYTYFGVGLQNQVPWRFRLNSPYADYDRNLDDYFQGMIDSLNIYANP